MKAKDEASSFKDLKTFLKIFVAKVPVLGLASPTPHILKEKGHWDNSPKNSSHESFV